MSEFETNPEAAQRAELAKLDKDLEAANWEYSELPEGDMDEETLDKATVIQGQALEIKSNIYRALLVLKDSDEIRARVSEYVDFYVEEEMEPDIGEILFDLFGIDECYELEPLTEKVVSDIIREYNLPEAPEE